MPRSSFHPSFPMTPQTGLRYDVVFPVTPHVVWMRRTALISKDNAFIHSFIRAYWENYHMEQLPLASIHGLLRQDWPE
ncbi:hypothetical protein BLNAU_19658 [Blattamonas nauphoetae]|uniref:Uncharacterized protein n=1 Tax=Blattamonas nauphoetae TaxID=2049346 RepID=A0ABQ9X0T7_9EUKA|nr:hypothetical protein BLNAU_19658 [Blattamonas nauphoetae]